MTLPGEHISAEATPEVLLGARDHYRDCLDQIEAQLDRSSGTHGVAPHYVAVANQELARSIDAALTLGDLDLLDIDVRWMEGLLRHHGMPAEMLYRYLSAYYQAARGQLDERAAPILSWLSRFTNN
jgi:hypothetical protein